MSLTSIENLISSTGQLWAEVSLTNKAIELTHTNIATHS